jgi:hypothetical protein
MKNGYCFKPDGSKNYGSDCYVGNLESRNYEEFSIGYCNSKGNSDQSDDGSWISTNVASVDDCEALVAKDGLCEYFIY